MFEQVTKEEFIEYLEQFPSDSVVGISRTLCECPLANYYKTIFPENVKRFWVTSSDIYIYENQDQKVTEQIHYWRGSWHAQFITKLDYLDREPKPVTTKECKEILEHIFNW